MTRFSTKTLLMAAALSALATPAFAQAAAPTPWVLSPDMGYGYGKDGKTFSYKMGTNNAGLLLKGAKKVPKGTLFFIGQNGQLYMRTGAVPRRRRQVHVRAGVRRNLPRRGERPGPSEPGVRFVSNASCARRRSGVRVPAQGPGRRD